MERLPSSFTEEDDLLKYDFDTAWDAPRGVVVKLRDKLMNAP